MNKETFALHRAFMVSVLAILGFLLPSYAVAQWVQGTNQMQTTLDQVIINSDQSSAPTTLRLMIGSGGFWDITNNMSGILNFGYKGANTFQLDPVGKMSLFVPFSSPPFGLTIAPTDNSATVTGFDITSSGSLNPYYGTGRNFQIFQGVPGSGVLKFIVNAEGNVGIGTSTPAQKLDVSGNINTSGNITANGNVGIGTTNPAYKLDVVGPINSSQTISSAIMRATSIYSPTFAVTEGGVTKAAISYTPGYTQFTTTGSSNFVFYPNPTSSGKVGIGTATPTQKLDVAGNINTSGRVQADSVCSRDFYLINNAGGNGNGYWLKGGSVVNGSATQNTFEIDYDNDGSYQQLMVINGDTHSVGIGTTPTKGALHVRGSMHVETSTGDHVFHVSATRQLVFVGAEAYSTFKAATSSSSAIQADNFALWVSKGVVGEDFAIAEVADWDDFVFDKNYQLPSLGEVAAYVQKNKHLPNVPSAEEVKHGYSVHNMNRSFLKTMEELTLYAIQQQAEIETLRKEINTLKDMISGSKK